MRKYIIYIFYNFPIQSSSTEIKAEVALTTTLLEGVANGREGLAEALAKLTEELYFKIEVQLIKSAVASAEEKVTY